MNEQEMRKIMYVNVDMTVEKLTDLELATLNNIAQLDMNPRGRIFDYEMVKNLFTEAEGTRMHEETKIALSSVVITRLACNPE